MHDDSQLSSHLRVALLAGGHSAERPVSLESGKQAAAALRTAGHDVECFDPAETEIEDVDWEQFDACFIALHGGAGEDGRVQQALERQGIAYTGSGPVASRLAMSKSAAKERFYQAGVPTLPYVLFHVTDPVEQVRSQVAGLGFPVVVKPDSQGSSLGVALAAGPHELPAAIEAAGRLDPFVLAEMFVRGREFTVAVLDRTPLPLLEISAPEALFSYEAKYHDGQMHHHFDTGLAPRKATQLMQTAVAAAAALDTSGLVRIDLLLDGADCPWVLEVNTVPGLTATSLAPRAASAAGYDLPALCEWMVREAMSTKVAR